MTYLSNFDIINEKGPFKLEVKEKSTGDIFIIQQICELCENEQEILLKQINLRKNITHPNILTFYEYIIDDATIYLKQEHCHFGVLFDFVVMECINKNRYLHEEFLCRIFYQAAFALKTIECFIGDLDLNTILLDDKYCVKLYNFYNLDNRDYKQKEIKMNQLGRVMFYLTTLKPFNKHCYMEDIDSTNYSRHYKNLLVSMVNSNTEIKKHLSKILSHPTILLHSTQWTEHKCFLTDTTRDTTKSEYLEKLERIRKREASLKLKEDMLKERERKLENKEKKLHILERNLTDKILQVELYLKRCREGGRSANSGSSKASTNSQSSLNSQKMSCEDMDSTYISCLEVPPTSTKLQVEKITKPQHFTRTLSERRITFKTSPLKDNTLHRKTNNRKSIRHSTILEHIDIKSCIKKPPPELAEYQNDLHIEIMKKSDTVNTSKWTKENKKYAFDMLRLLNSEDKENIDIRQTYL